ncbi:MAG TPA: phage portal protein [Ktedonobacterales bacterium]|nr:phage portal protein [Ktedonobacterales bacterium]
MAALPVEPDEAPDALQDNTRGPKPGDKVALPDLPQKELKRRRRIDDTWKAYRGEWGAGPLKVQPGDPDDNVKPNNCQPIVDVGVNFLFGEPLKIEVSNTTDGATGVAVDIDNGSDDGTSPAQAFLDECWGDPDDMMTLLTELATNGAIAGSAYALLVPANEDAGEERPHVQVLDPANVFTIADPHDCKLAREYWIQYDVESYDPATGDPFVMTYRKMICRNDPDGYAYETIEGYDNDDSWLILDFERKGVVETGGYRSTGAQSSAWLCTARTPWPRPYAPIVHCQNLPNPNQFEGLTDLPHDLIQMNRALIFNESNIMRTIKHFVAPMRYASGVTAATISTGPDRMLLFQSPDAKLNALDVKADLANAMAYSDSLRAAMDEQSQIPGIALGRMKDIPRGQVTGPVFQALYKPPMSKTTKKRRLYGRLIREASLHLLDLGGFSEAAKAKVLLHWQNPMPKDELVEAQAAQAWSGLGVSNDSLMQAYTDFNPDTEAEKKQQESQNQMLSFAHGTGAPPMDMNALAASAQMNTSGPDGDNTQNQQPPATPPPINHPAAIAQRAKMTATAKG